MLRSGIMEEARLWRQGTPRRIAPYTRTASPDAPHAAMALRAHIGLRVSKGDSTASLPRRDGLYRLPRLDRRERRLDLAAGVAGFEDRLPEDVGPGDAGERHQRVTRLVHQFDVPRRIKRLARELLDDDLVDFRQQHLPSQPVS